MCLHFTPEMNEQPLPISYTTPPETICDILRSANCHRVYTQSTACLYFIVSTLRTLCAKQQYALRIDDVPALGFVLPQVKDKNARRTLNVGPYPPSERKFSPDDVAIYLPSSQSAPSSRPVPLTHKAVTEWQRTGQPNLHEASTDPDR